MGRIGCNLDEVIVSTFLDAQHFPELWLRLEVEVFGATTTQNNDAVARGMMHNRGCFIHIGQRVKREQAAIQGIARHVHANR